MNIGQVVKIVGDVPKNYRNNFGVIRKFSECNDSVLIRFTGNMSMWVNTKYIVSVDISDFAKVKVKFFIYDIIVNSIKLLEKLRRYYD